jgi:predicted amidophosphoribosyltransferase
MSTKLHESLTEERVCAAVENGMFGLENPGFCIACGADADGCEPDAENYHCEDCGENQVFGAEQILFML